MQATLRIEMAMIMAAVMGAGCVCARAHQELYHNVEVNLRDTGESGRIQVYLTVHAPELLVGSEDAADAMFDGTWLQGLPTAEIEELIALARAFVGETLTLAFEPGTAVDLRKAIAFADAARIGDPDYRPDLPPACILGTVSLRLPRAGGTLRVGNREGSEKRMLLVIQRPKAFPEVIDLDAGEDAAVALPRIPGGGLSPRQWGYTALFLFLMAGAGVLQALRGRRLARRMESES